MKRRVGQGTNIKRPRAGAVGVRKVKSGCQTCKIRHKKCDESRPACAQCSSTGRKCDFETPSRAIAINQLARAAIVPIPYNIMKPPIVESSQNGSFCDDARYFGFFENVCAKEFQLYFDLDCWQTIVLQMARAEPSIAHCALAIGAFSICHYYPDKLTSSLSSVTEYALRQYNIAIRTLNDRIDDSLHGWELAIMSSIMFIAIEYLQGFENRVQMHLESALSALEEYRQKSPTTIGAQASTFTSSPLLGSLVRALSHLSLQFSSFSAHQSVQSMTLRK